MPTRLSRRAVITGATALGALAIFSRSGLAADFKFRQFHNQALSSPLHKRLVEMWAAVKTETNGRVETAVRAPTASISKSEPATAAIQIGRRGAKAVRRRVRAAVATVAGGASEVWAMRSTKESIDLSNPSNASIHWRVDSSYAKASLGWMSCRRSAITGTW